MISSDVLQVYDSKNSLLGDFIPDKKDTFTIWVEKVCF